MPRSESITSAANPLVKDVKRAVARGSLTAQGWWVAETFHLFEEALRSGLEVRVVLASESVSGSVEQHLRRHREVRVAILPDDLMQNISSVESTQGVIALVSPPPGDVRQLFGRLPLVVVLDGLQDAGNAGTIARAAEAFGATGIVFAKGTASPYHPKTLRASAGSLFRVPFVHGVSAVEVRDLLHAEGVDVYAAMPTASLHPSAANLARPCALVIGSEAHGVGEHLHAASRALSIPTTGVESLNAAVAAGILLYEAARQRTSRT